MRDRKIRKLLIKSLPIETERLILRNIEPKDAMDMYEYSSLDEVTEFLLWDPHINIEATEGYIEFLQKRYLRGLFADWAVVLKESDKMIGTCGYAAMDSSNNTCEIGYVLSPFYRGKGYMTEALEAVLDLSFEKLFLDSAWLRIINENLSSKKLAEHVGFKIDRIGYEEMHIKGRDRDIAHYVLTKEAYNDKKRSG